MKPRLFMAKLTAREVFSLELNPEKGVYGILSVVVRSTTFVSFWI